MHSNENGSLHANILPDLVTLGKEIPHAHAIYFQNTPNCDLSSKEILVSAPHCAANENCQPLAKESEACSQAALVHLCLHSVEALGEFFKIQ